MGSRTWEDRYYYEASLLSQYQASPRVGHLEAAYHVFAYLEQTYNSANPIPEKYEPALQMLRPWPNAGGQ